MARRARLPWTCSGVGDAQRARPMCATRSVPRPKCVSDVERKARARGSTSRGRAKSSRATVYSPRSSRTRPRSMSTGVESRLPSSAREHRDSRSGPKPSLRGGDHDPRAALPTGGQRPRSWAAGSMACFRGSRLQPVCRSPSSASSSSTWTPVYDRHGARVYATESVTHAHPARSHLGRGPHRALAPQERLVLGYAPASGLASRPARGTGARRTRVRHRLERCARSRRSVRCERRVG